MALSKFRIVAARFRAEKGNNGNGASNGGVTQDGSEKNDSTSQRAIDISTATKARRRWIAISSLLYFLSVIFLILTIIGNLNNKAVIRKIYFFKLDLTNVIPASNGVPLHFVNSLARSLGLYDFYQVGLWNFCAGYNDEGIVFCTHPKALFYFNPVDILLSELLSGATIALPAEVNKIIDLIKIASRTMFGLFVTGACMNFVNIFLSPLVIYTRWISLLFSVWTFLAALFITAATIIATVMSVVFRNVVTSQEELDIGASVGKDMFAFMWLATFFSVLGWVIHASLACCCDSRRDVRTGRRSGCCCCKSMRPVSENAVQEKKSPKAD